MGVHGENVIGHNRQGQTGDLKCSRLPKMRRMSFLETEIHMPHFSYGALPPLDVGFLRYRSKNLLTPPKGKAANAIRPAAGYKTSFLSSIDKPEQSSLCSGLFL